MIATPDTVQKEKLLGLLTTGHLVNDFYSVTLPFLLPTLILTFELSFFEAGLLSLVTSLFSGILQPVVGYMADRYAKRKMVMLLGFGAFSMGLFLAGLSISFPLLLFSFFVFGLGQATFHAQSTNLITKAFPVSKGRAMGIHGIGGSIGNFLAPIVATFLITAIGWRYTTSVLAVPGLFMLVMFGLWLSDPAKPQTVTQEGFSFSAKLLVLAVNFSLIYMIYIGFLTFLPTFLVENGSTLGEAGLISAFMLFIGFFAQPAGGYIYDKLGGRFLFMIDSLLIGGALLLLAGGNNGLMILIVALIGGAATSTFPVTLAMGSELAKGKNVGASVGFVFGISGVLSAFSPALTGYVADSFGLEQSFRLLAILAILSLVVAFFLPVNEKKL